MPFGCVMGNSVGTGDQKGSAELQVQGMCVVGDKGRKDKIILEFQVCDTVCYCCLYVHENIKDHLRVPS